MCHECDDDSDDLDITELLKDAPEEFKEEFYEYAMEQMSNVMKTAEKMDVLYELLTEWPAQKITAFEYAVFIAGRSSDNDME